VIGINYCKGGFIHIAPAFVYKHCL